MVVARAILFGGFSTALRSSTDTQIADSALPSSVFKWTRRPHYRAQQNLAGDFNPIPLHIPQELQARF
jgi:hypothetical protein